MHVVVDDTPSRALTDPSLRVSVDATGTFDPSFPTTVPLADPDGEDASGVIIALRAIGAIAAGLIAARFVRTGPDTLWPVASGVAVAAAVGLLPALNHVLPIALWMLVIGLGSGAMTLYFQITISEASRPEERGSALALGGLGWSVSHLSTPLVMGFLADQYGIVNAFYVLGGFALASTVVLAAMRRWAFASMPPLRAPSPP